MSKTPIIAVIPARGGSKRAPGKNTALYRGRPLVAHTIEQAIDSGLFNDIVVTTDSHEVRGISQGYSVTLHKRHKNLADDNATLLEVIQSLGAEEKWPTDAVIVLLQVTAPLRMTEDIKQAYQLYINSDKTRAVVSVAQNDHPIQLSMRIEGGRLTPVFPESYQKGLRKQDQGATYRWNDAVMVDKFESLLDSSRANLFGESPIPYEMPLERSVAIDYPFHLEICQYLRGLTSS
ncbi:acylneuraminate cytidylyltransferase family protein [Arenicellales bacterium IMCC55707]